MYLFGGDQGETFGEVKPHLIPKNGNRTRARPVGFAGAVVKNMLEEVLILFHRYLKLSLQ